jgi:prepilin-type N-terminal cleavage/methylation domain-containing protein
MRARKNGFSLIELLMVLGVMSILMGMLIPSVGVVREKAQRMATGQKLRQVGLAVATYHSITGRSLAADDLADWMERLASETGVREGKLFIFEEDPLVSVLAESIPPVLVENSGSGDWEVVRGFADWPIGIAVASGVSPLADPSTTPIAWSRGLTPDGTWLDHGSPRAGIYGSEGGFIVFLDGHVEFHRDLRTDGGQLVTYNEGRRTANIREALGPGVAVHDFRGSVF